MQEVARMLQAIQTTRWNMRKPTVLKVTEMHELTHDSPGHPCASAKARKVRDSILTTSIHRKMCVCSLVATDILSPQMVQVVLMLGFVQKYLVFSVLTKHGLDSLYCFDFACTQTCLLT